MADFDAQILNCPTPRWWIWDDQGVPGVCMSLPATFRNGRDVPVALVSAHLEGIHEIAFREELIVAPCKATDAYLAGRMLSVVVEEGKILSGDVIFTDSLGERHFAGAASFESPPAFGPRVGMVPVCAFCGGAIAVEDYCAIFNGTSHRACIWK